MPWRGRAKPLVVGWQRLVVCVCVVSVLVFVFFGWMMGASAWACVGQMIFTIFLVGTSTLQKIPHSIHKTLNQEMSRRCTALPPAALPSLSMATSAMDPNRGAAAPYESNVGGRRQGLRLLRLIPLFGHQNGTHQKIGRWAEHRDWVAATRL